MNIRSIIVAVLMLTTAAPLSRGAEDAPTTQPVAVRNGLPNVAAKLNAGKPVTIVFLGSSATRGGGDRGLAALVPQWIQSTYPRSRINIVNSGIIETDSAFGAARLERDALAHNPDLLFVEFAAVRGEEERTADVERLIRTARVKAPELDVVFLYALGAQQTDDYFNGRLPAAAIAHDRIAGHYGVPSIAIGLDAGARLKQGRRWRELFRDEMTPTPQGYTAYVDRITASLPALLAAGQTGKHPLPEPIKKDLVLDHEPAKAQPMPEAAPFMIRGGAKSKVTYDLPTPGVHWIGTPEFKLDGDRTLWRLQWQSAFANGKRLNGAFSLDRSQWGGPMQWFDEYRFFHGPAGIPLLRFREGDGVQISAREDDLPVITFVAPRAGRYAFSVSSSGLSFWGLHRAIAMNVVHFPAGKNKGTSLAVHRTEENQKIDLWLQEEVRLAEGDELAFCVDTNATAGGGGAMFRNLVLKVGFFGE